MTREASPVDPALSTTSRTAGTTSTAEQKPLPLDEIETAIRSIRHGVVQIIIQDGVVVQIDRTDKLRLR